MQVQVRVQVQELVQPGARSNRSSQSVTMRPMIASCTPSAMLLRGIRARMTNGLMQKRSG